PPRPRARRSVARALSGAPRAAREAPATSGPVLLSVDAADCGPIVVEGGALVVDEPGVEADPLDVGEGEVRLQLRAALRVGDPEPVGRRERALQLRESPF